MEKNWDTHLPCVLFAYRSSSQESTSETLLCIGETLNYLVRAASQQHLLLELMSNLVADPGKGLLGSDKPP